VSFAAIILCVASQRVFIIVLACFVIDSIRKLLDTPAYRGVITNDVSDYVNLLVRIAHIICNQPL
jgi:hypothetical protein